MHASVAPTANKLLAALPAGCRPTSKKPLSASTKFYSCRPRRCD